MMPWYQWLLSHDWPTDDIRRLAHLDDRNTRGGVRRDGATCSCRPSSPRRRWSVVLVVLCSFLPGLRARCSDETIFFTGRRAREELVGAREALRIIIVIVVGETLTWSGTLDASL